MLGRIGHITQCTPISTSQIEDRYQRNEQEDLKKAIDYLYEFREKLSKLNPVVIDLIDNMLQRPKY